MDKKEKFTCVYNKYKKVIINYFFKQTYNSDISEELCHEVFIQYYLKIDSIKEHATKSWLYKTSTFVLLNYLRRVDVVKRYDHVIQEKYCLENHSDKQSQLDAKIILEDALTIFFKDIDDLDKVIYNFIVFKENSVKEIAFETDCSIGQIIYKSKKFKHWLLSYLSNIGIKSFYQI